MTFISCDEGRQQVVNGFTAILVQAVILRNKKNSFFFRYNFSLVIDGYGNEDITVEKLSPKDFFT